jgi:hypothetical protein
MLIIFLYSCGFASSFTILAQSQIQFDDIPDDQLKHMEYNHIVKAIWYVYNSYVLGSKSQKSFTLGDGSQIGMLLILYFLATLIFLMILFKMLVALMGATFAKRSKVINEITVRDKLRFVMDNWHLIDKALEDKSKVKYIITALPASFNQEDPEGQIEEVYKQLKHVENLGQNNYLALEENLNRVNYIV